MGRSAAEVQRMSRLKLFASAALLLTLVATAPVRTREAPGDRSELAPPFAITIGGARLDAPLDKEGRHLGDNANPWFADFDGDGKPDLLVGRGAFSTAFPEGGRLCVYKNLGAKGRPRFGDPLWFDDLVPTGRIPQG
jgi:hypothetical protein